MTDFLPYQFQTDIMGSSLRLDLVPFSDAEMAAFLDNFTQELRISLNNDLKFFLTDFAQGYPWLLRKLCAHVKAQLDSGIPQIDRVEFREQAKLADITFSLVMRDMERLELVTENEGKVKLHFESFENLEEFNKSLHLHLQESLPNNRLISRLLKTLEREYARTFAKLMEAAHLATFNSREQILIKYELNAKASENSIPQARHHVGITVPWTYYSKVKEVMVKLYEAIQRGEQVELTHVGLKANTLY